MKPIAIIANSINFAFDWMREHYKDDIQEINGAKRRILLKNGQLYVIIVNREQALGMEFSSFIIAPDYETLIDVIKERIR